MSIVGIWIVNIQIVADDIVFIIKDNCTSLRNLFKTYHQFSQISGIELNTTKTEIMRIGDNQIEKEYIIEDNTGQEVQIKPIDQGCPTF